MTPKNQIKRATPSLSLVTLVLACFAFLPQMQAALPPEIPGNSDGCYPNFATAEGCQALNGPSAFTGLGNTALGWRSLFFSGPAFWNTGTGAGALAINTGNENTATGAGALLINLGADNNTADGAFALFQNLIGFDNTAVGQRALFNNDIDAAGFANRNTAVGARAMLFNIDGARNIAVGADALGFNVIASDNTAIGDLALANNDVTGNNLAVQNTAVGAGALFGNTDGNSNTAVGNRALFSNDTGSSNTAIGFEALLNNTTGGTLATTEGFDVGPNTAVGANALGANTIASANTAVGYQALGSMVAGYDFGTGTPTDVGVSTAVGFQALANVNSLSNAANDAFGYQALFNLIDGLGNVAIGSQAGFSLTSGNGNIYIGNPGAGPESNTIRIGGLTVFPGPRRTFIRGIREVTTENDDAIPVVIDSDGQLGTMSSSRRFKHEIKAMDNASEAIHALKPVTFHYKSDATSTPQFGLIAEEVANVNPDLVVRDAGGEIYTVRYDAVNAMLLNEFLKEHGTVQEQSRKIQEQEATIAQLKRDFQSRLAEQQKQIETLTEGLQKVSAQLEASKPAPQVVVSNQ